MKIYEMDSDILRVKQGRFAR